MADKPFADNDLNRRSLYLAQSYIDPALRPKGMLEEFGFGGKPEGGYIGLAENLPEDDYIRDLLKTIFMKGDLFRKPEPKKKETGGRTIRDYVNERNEVINNS